MTAKFQPSLFPINKASLYKRMIIGALIGLSLIVFFLSGTENHPPDWGRFWMVRPLLIVPFAGAMGGAFNYFVSSLNLKSDRAKLIGLAISLIVFVIGLWMGFVLGLVGTYWN